MNPWMPHPPDSCLASQLLPHPYNHVVIQLHLFKNYKRYKKLIIKLILMISLAQSLSCV